MVGPILLAYLQLHDCLIHAQNLTTADYCAVLKHARDTKRTMRAAELGGAHLPPPFINTHHAKTDKSADVHVTAIKVYEDCVAVYSSSGLTAVYNNNSIDRSTLSHLLFDPSQTLMHVLV